PTRRSHDLAVDLGRLTEDVTIDEPAFLLKSVLSSQQYCLDSVEHRHLAPIARFDDVGRKHDAVLVPVDVIPLELPKLSRPHGRMTENEDRFAKVVGRPGNRAIRTLRKQHL